MTREEAIETLKENVCSMCAYLSSQSMDSCDIRSCDNRDAIKALEQDQKTGHWIITRNKDGEQIKVACSRCSYNVNYFWSDWKSANYCPHCGAKMIQAESEE